MSAVRAKILGPFNLFPGVEDGHRCYRPICEWRSGRDDGFRENSLRTHGYEESPGSGGVESCLGNGNHYDAVLCGGSLRKCEWKDAMRYVLQGSPDFPLIISRRIGTERKSVEVLGAGAFDLLPTPHVERSVLGLLEDAVASYEARRMKNVCHGAYHSSKRDKRDMERGSHPGSSAAGREGFSISGKSLIRGSEFNPLEASGS